MKLRDLFINSFLGAGEIFQFFYKKNWACLSSFSFFNAFQFLEKVVDSLQLAIKFLLKLAITV